MELETKLDSIKKHLLKYRSIDARTMIYTYHYFNTTDAISKLRKAGMNIISERKANSSGSGSHVLYKLIVEVTEEQLKLF